MTENEKRLTGLLYDPLALETDYWTPNRQALEAFNATAYQVDHGRMEILKPILDDFGDDCYIEPPFYCDKGKQIHLGNHFYANTGLLILDAADVFIGDHVFVGPRTSIYTACHPIDAAVRNTGLEYAKAVHIGNNVWLGGNVVINPGVTIGDNSIIGSGSVVTKNIPANVIATGNPCRVIREIAKEDKKYWEQELENYRK